MNSRRVFIEKKKDYNSERKLLRDDFKDYLKLDTLEDLRILNVYDLIGFEKEDEEKIIETILFESSLDNLYEGSLELLEDEKAFRLKYLEGQFNQREDSANRLVRLTLGEVKGYISHTEVYVLRGISEGELDKLKKYFVNPVEMKEISMEEVVERKIRQEEPVDLIHKFREMDSKELLEFKENYALGMDLEDIEFCQNYYKEEGRDPNITELKLIDTYWSDHCRHTTFMTEITDIKIDQGRYEKLFQETIDEYMASRDFVYGEREKLVCLMDLATINQKEVKKKGLLDDKEDTEEVNAASIEIDVDVDGETERWLLMFKNETHNHPTEIEPFGGAATCLGGAIRDPLSGRSYVYQAMRITGSADPRTPFEETLEGKLPQKKITETARAGYSSYGYEIGAATGYVREIYDPGYVAKRMEVGALVAAAPKENVYRGQAEAGDLIVLVGGKTGKDGLGGAVGSSKKHTEDSLEDSGAEVQKGNAKIERKILRLFRRKEVSSMIKVCNDFGAGGVSVAIGELADGVYIDLDKVPVKYEGMNAYEIALSESQERMAALIDSKDLDKFLEYSREEDLEATLVARVTEEKVLKMVYRGEEIVSINREFLDTNGIRKKNKVRLSQPETTSFFEELPKEVKGQDLAEDFVNNMADLNIGSQRGLMEGFDESIGKATVLAGYGGKHQLTQTEGMVAKLPVLEGETSSCSLMTYGYDPHIANWSSFHAGYYAVLESLGRIVALGGSYEKVRLSLQEYFERIGQDPEKWGKPFAALLGAYKVQKAFDTPAIGGKDSMSGSFEDLHVPPTIISFAVTTDRVENIMSPEFKEAGSEVGILEFKQDEDYLVDLEEVKAGYRLVKELVDRGLVNAISTVKYGGAARSIGEMCLGNKIGFEFMDTEEIFRPSYGSLIIEFKDSVDPKEVFKDLNYRSLGRTLEEELIKIDGKDIYIDEVIDRNLEVLASTFKLQEAFEAEEVGVYEGRQSCPRKFNEGQVKVLIPIVTGTYGEYDLRRSFEKAGAQVDEFVLKTRYKEEFEKSVEELAAKIEDYHILAFPDGRILGDEPEGGGKFLKLILNKPSLKAAVEKHIEEDRLIIGIGAGFMGLIKSGLIEHGRIVEGNESSLSISYNKENKFISRMVDIELKSNLSPWLTGLRTKEVFTVPLATDQGRIVGDLDELAKNGQICTVFKDNILGSSLAVDGLSNKKGNVIGFSTSIDRDDSDLFKNIDKKSGIEKIFEAGVKYFK